MAEKRRRLGAREVAEALEAKSELSRRCLAFARERPPRTEGHGLRVADAVARADVQAHSIGVGRKITDGEPTNTACVRIYVAQKLPLGLVPESARLPGKIEGVPTDVIEAPPAYFAPLQPCSLQRRKPQRPLRPGLSGASAVIAAGTLAAVCRSRRAGEQHLRLLLSNNHVLAAFGAIAAGAPILQPSAQDGGVEANDRVATLLRAIAVQEGQTGENRVDAAVAAVDAGVAIEPSICTVGAIAGSEEPKVGTWVHKHGRTTGYTVGVIDDVSCDFVLPLSRDDPTRVARFIGQIRIVPRQGSIRFAQAGDSGSLVLTRAGNRAIGLLFACPDDASFAYANPIGRVLDALEIDLE